MAFPNRAKSLDVDRKPPPAHLFEQSIEIMERRELRLGRKNSFAHQGERAQSCWSGKNCRTNVGCIYKLSLGISPVLPAAVQDNGVIEIGFCVTHSQSIKHVLLHELSKLLTRGFLYYCTDNTVYIC